MTALFMSGRSSREDASVELMLQHGSPCSLTDSRRADAVLGMPRVR